MAITYPLDLPATPAPNGILIKPAAVVGVGVSPFTLQQHAQEHQGQRWAADVSMPKMLVDPGENWATFFLKLNGRAGTFLMGDPVRTTPRGVATGTPVVDGAGQKGKVLLLRGATPDVVGWYKRGDWLQIGYRLYKNLNDADSDSGGLVELDIWPRLRESPADGATVIINNARGLFRLATNEMPYSHELGGFYKHQFSAIEAI